MQSYSSERRQIGTGLPEVSLPGGDVTITEAAKTLGGLMAETDRYFRRGDSVSRLETNDNGERILRVLQAAALSSEFESVARLVRVQISKSETKRVHATCTEHNAKLILHADVFLKTLPQLRLLSQCPVLIERDGRLTRVIGYDSASGVLAFGERLPDVPLRDAVLLLSRLLSDFHFATPSDRSRALAALITPSMVQGGILGARSPVDLGEADQSQAGKGFRNKITAAVFRQQVRTVTQRKGGVGSLEESFNSMLALGAIFVSLDNVRGRLDSPAIESFLTEDWYLARIPYRPDVEIDPRRVVLMFTSNRAEITEDLANRSCCVRLLKQDEKHQFARYDEGDILDHVRSNQALYLAAVFAVVEEWHRRGKPRTAETRHDFRRWAQTLDWIVQHILGEAPLLDGHNETKVRMTNSNLTWFRDVALAVSRAGRESNWLRAHELLDILLDAGDIEIPGVKEETDMDDEQARSSALRCLGRKLGRCFGDGLEITIDQFDVERRQTSDEQGRLRYEYQISSRFPRSPASPRVGPRVETADSRVPRVGSELCDIDGTIPVSVESIGARGERGDNAGETQNSDVDEEVEWTF